MEDKVIRMIYVYGDNWEGVYINNLLWLEGCEISNQEWDNLWIQFSSLKLENINSYELDEEWLNNQGRLPQYFDQIPQDKIIK